MTTPRAELAGWGRTAEEVERGDVLDRRRVSRASGSQGGVAGTEAVKSWIRRAGGRRGLSCRESTRQFEGRPAGVS